jgi:transposase
MRRRFDLTDFEWAIIEPLLPNKPRGVPRVDDRRVLNGILWRFRTGSLGLIFPSAMGHIRSATTASSAGAQRGFGTGFWRRFRRH